MAEAFTAAGRGDPEAEGRLIAEYAPRLRFLIRRRVGRPDDVEDVLQEVLTALVEAIRKGSLRHIGAFPAFARSLCLHKCLDWQRRRYRGLSSAGADDPPELVDPGTDVQARLEHLEECRQVRRALDRVLPRLKPRDRTVFLEYYVQERRAEEVCSRHGLRLDHLRQIRHRALEKLRRAYLEQAGES
jgi:RNA polymerase sigma-70 factor (ECF subfamily)